MYLYTLKIRALCCSREMLCFLVECMVFVETLPPDISPIEVNSKHIFSRIRFNVQCAKSEVRGTYGNCSIRRLSPFVAVEIIHNNVRLHINMSENYRINRERQKLMAVNSKY
jgi:hypothetical protein